MKNHHYRITVEHLSTPDGQAVDVPGTLQFECGAHDNILALVQRSRQRGDFDADTAAAFTVGLKLLGEVILKNRKHQLFEELGPQFGQFMKRLKSQ